MNRAYPSRFPSFSGFLRRRGVDFRGSSSSILSRLWGGHPLGIMHLFVLSPPFFEFKEVVVTHRDKHSRGAGRIVTSMVFLFALLLFFSGCCFIPFTATHGPYAVFLSGAIMVPAPLNKGGVFYFNPFYGTTEGSLYANRQGVVPDGLRKGEACASNIGYFLTRGDASIKAAADNGGIQRVFFVDYVAENIFLGFYAKYCAIVWGLP